MLREAFLERTRQEVALAVANQKGVLVVGARDSNVQSDLVESELLTLWPFDDTRVFGKPIPKHTGVVLFTRFVRHATVGSVYKQALANGMFCMQQCLQTGELRTVLSPLLDAAALPPTKVNGTTPHQPMVVEVDKKKAYTPPAKFAQHGEIRDLVAEYGNLNAKRVTEGRRLLNIAKGLGITTTLDSVCQSITQARKKKAQASSVATVEQRGNATVYRAEPEPSARPVADQVAATLPSASALTSNLDESVRLLNESIAALTLVRDELIKTKTSVEQDYASLSKLRQLKELLGSI